MGALIPLYLAGLSALSLPLIFHLVRRTPRGRQDFSSLMFLSPTIPKLTRRSRIDQILLLLLRLAALACVAFAFSRPFLREASLLSLADLSGRRVAILIDSSASMRRGDLWQQAIAQAEKELDELNPQDDVALFTFSNRLQTIVDFALEESAAIDDKPQVIRNRLHQLQPDWNTTDLGTALVAVASELDSSSDARQSTLEPQIVVISDFQAGSRTEAVRSFEWPKRVPVVAHPVKLIKTTNAFAHVLPNEEGDDLTETRVRVVNASDSKTDQFFLNWVSDKSPAKKSNEVAVYVPAGQSRVVRLPRGVDDLAADRIVLRGDDQDFDNTYYVVPPLKLSATILYAGADKPDSPEGLQYFLRLAVANDPLRQVEVKSIDEKLPLFAPADSAPALIVVTRPVITEWQTPLKTYVERGGTLLFVPENRDAAVTLSTFFDDLALFEKVTEETKPAAAANKYLLLGDIDFVHPLFASVAGARYSDFTKIHFWKHIAVELKKPVTTHVIARFDNHDPALLERLSGQGRVLALLSGWQPRDSQFAVSSKFVPFIGSLLDLASGNTGTAARVTVNEPVNLPRDKTSPAIVVQGPERRDSSVDAGQATFTATDRPGIYLAKTSPKETRFAVNLAMAESNTAPLDLEQLEQGGVRMGAELSRSERVDRIRQQRDTELENRQKIWRWLIVVAIGTLIFETWLAGRQERALRTAVSNPAI
ncbi:MAG: hypothetical protein JWM11_6903 [Planctomycetaceae bacterium]|nr:hypothetical protein [Planctomycetaceae bacterium]